MYKGDYCLAYSSEGVPYISFTSGGVKLAYKTDSGWKVEIVGSGSSWVTSLVLDGNDNPCISYTVSRVITYATRD